MKEKIEYEYQIDVKNLIFKNNYYMFEENNQYFYLILFKHTEEEIKDIILLYEELKAKNYPVHTIVKTTTNNLFITYEDKHYLLLLVTNPLKEYSIYDLINNSVNLKLTNKTSVLKRTSWALLWSEKIDYFEYQIRQLGKDKKIVLNSFSYFIGLSENAISYAFKVENNIPNNNNYTLGHKRIYYPNYHLNYNNPLQFVFDLEVRDIAEYLKSLALNDYTLALIDLESYLKIKPLDLYSLSMLYARLIFPTYYFDLYENIMNFKEDEECLIKLIDKIKDMEIFLQKSYLLISKYAPIEPINWLMNKDVTN